MDVNKGSFFDVFVALTMSVVTGLDCKFVPFTRRSGYSTYVLKQWITLLARCDWLLKLGIASAIHLREFARENCNR